LLILKISWQDAFLEAASFAGGTDGETSDMSQLSLEPLHRFHPYCARFPSEIVEYVLDKYSKPGDSIFDPFCGSGTTLVAGFAHKRWVIGSDIDTLAGILSEVKCAPLAPARYADWRVQFASRLAIDFEMIARTWRPRPLLCPGITWSIEALQLRIPEFPQLPRLRPH
jgi:DNA methylase